MTTAPVTFRPTKRKLTVADVIIYFVCFLFLLVTIIPLIYVLSCSISDPLEVMRNNVLLIPKGISFGSYLKIFSDSAFFTGYGNTIKMTLVGTLVSIVLTITTAYPLSRRDFVLRKPAMLFVLVTMFISGGMIPKFILINRMHLYDSQWAVILTLAISTYNLIVARTFFEGLPVSLIESARLDGAGELRTLWSIVIPLSKPIIAVLVLFYAVDLWNAYFYPMMYISSRDKQPVTLYLYRILNQATASVADGDSGFGLKGTLELLQTKYTAIIVTVLPVTIIYPFVQRYFVTGVMIGAVKG